MLDKERTFEDKLFGIRTYLKKRSEENRDTLFSQVEFKLDRSLDNYYKEMELKINYILSRNNYKVIKNINKELSKKDKEEEDEENENN